MNFQFKPVVVAAVLILCVSSHSFAQEAPPSADQVPADQAPEAVINDQGNEIKADPQEDEFQNQVNDLRQQIKETRDHLKDLSAQLRELMLKHKGSVENPPDINQEAAK